MKALVLAGGGAKGSYQIGVWKALRELNWTPDIITGTSVGSLNGALFAAGKWEAGEQLWRSLTRDGVIDFPDDWNEVQELVKKGGLDVTPLEHRIEEIITEEQVRDSSIRFGLVTVEMSGMKARELSVEEIPQGRLADYLLASSACFPAFRPREIDGVKYIDGGYWDNMPCALAARMGATELLCVDINGIGINQANRTGLPTTNIESHWDLGGILDFSPERAARNIRLGYLDTLRAFGRLWGDWYALDDDREYMTELGRALELVMQEKLADSNLKMLKEVGALMEKFQSGQKRVLPMLESAARNYCFSPTEVYAPRKLAWLVLDRWQKEVSSGAEHWMQIPGRMERGLLSLAIEKTLR